MKKLLIPCLLAFLTGCVDNEYNKDIDMNVTIAENGISIPIGETDKFMLSKLISTDDNLKINGDSVYYISETTSSSTEFAAMKSVVVDPSNGLTPAIEPTAIDLPDEIVGAVDAGIYYNASIPLTLTADAPVDPSNLIVSEDVKRIDTIMFDAPIQATLSFTTELFAKQGPAEYVLSLSDLEISFPEMLILSRSGNIGDATLPDTDDNGTPLSVKDHKLTIAQKTAQGGAFSLSLNIYGICGGDIQPDGTNNFELIPENGENILNILNNRFTLNGDASVDVTLNGGGTTLASTPQVRTAFSIEEIIMTRINGIIDASAQESFSIEIGSMPDFLEGNDINLDLTNPFIRFSASNPMGIPVKASIAITPKNDKGESLTATPVTIDTIYIEEASYDRANQTLTPQENHIFISQKAPTTDWVDAEKQTFWFNDTLYTWVQGDLPALLDAQIPSALEASLSAQTDNTTAHIALLNDQSSLVHANCDITVPLEFGENLSINFSEIEGGIDDIFKDVTMKEASIIANYTTTLPLNLEFSLSPLQEITADVYHSLSSDEKIVDGEESSSPHYYRILRNIRLEILDADQNGKGIIAGTTDLNLVDPTPSTGKIVIRLTEEETGALKSLTHLKYTVAGSLAEGLQNGVLRNTQYLQMKLSARISQIAVDLGSL